MNGHQIYIKMERRAREQDAEETERESVWEREDSCKIEVALVVKWPLEKRTIWDKPELE